MIYATRDASWWSRPNVTTPKKYHVAIADGFDGYIALCNRRMLLVDHPEEKINPMSLCERCRRIKGLPLP